MGDNSKITTDLQVDDPVQLDNNYRLDKHDRRYIDNQIRGVEQHMVDLMLDGLTGTWYDLDSSSSSVVPGDCLCSAFGNAVKINASNVTNSNFILGVAMTVAPPGGKVKVAINGYMPPSLTGLSTGVSESVIVDKTTARMIRAATVGSSDLLVGTADNLGGVRFNGSLNVSGGGGGGGGLTTTYTVDASSPSITAGQWVVQTDSAADPPTIALVSSANASKGVIGIAMQSGSAGASIQVASTGQVAKASVTGLGAGTAGYIVVNTTTGLSNRKAVPAFQDIIGGTSDAHGNVTVSVLKSRIGELVINAQDYGVTGIEGDDASPGIEAAIAAALADNSTYPTIRTVLLPPGSIEPSRTIRLTPDPANFPNVGNQRIRLKGHGDATTIRPSHMGPAIGLYFDYSLLYPAVVASGPFGGGTSPCLQTHRVGASLFEYPAHPFPVDYHATLRHHGCGEFDGLAAFCFEGWVNSDTSTTTLGANNVFLLSGGYEGEQSGVLTSAIQFGYYAVSADHIFVELFFQNAGVVVLATSAAASLNAWHHVAVDYDGTTVRLWLDGVLGASQAVAGDKLSQHPCEGVFLGAGHSGLLEADFVGRFHGLIGPWRLTTQSRYTSAFTPPTAPFPDGGSFDLFVCNWDENYRDTWKFHFGGLGTPGTSRPGWLCLSQSSDFSNGAVFSTEVSDLRIYGNNSATAGGIFAQNATSSFFRNISGVLTHFTMWTRAQTYDSEFTNISHNGGGVFPGILDGNTGGNRYHNCTSANASYCYVIASGLNTMSNCNVGAWSSRGAGIYAIGALLTITNLFCDNESPSPNSRGTIYAVDASVFLRGSTTSTGPVTAEPMITNARSVVDIETMVISQGQITAWVDVIGSTKARTRVKVLDLTDDSTVFTTPPVFSSNGSTLGIVRVEPIIPQQAVAESILNRSSIANRQGQVDTTDATVTTVCKVPLDLHSVYVLDVEVTGRKTGGDDWAIYKLSHACTRKTGLAVDNGAIGTPTSVGSNAGNPPAGWGGVTIAVDDYNNALVQVQGLAATNIHWGANVVPSRIQGSTSNVTGTAPNTVTGCRAWYRGSVGFTPGTSWNDQSAVGNNLTLTGCTAGATLNGLATVHTNGTTDIARIASFSKGSAGEVTIVAVVRLYGNSTYVAAYSDNAFDGQYLSSNLTPGQGSGAAQVGGVGNAITGTALGRTDLSKWAIVAITGKAGGNQYFFHETEKQAGQASSCAIANSLPFQVGNGKMDLADVSVFDHVLTMTELAGVVSYYKAAFAL